MGYAVTLTCQVGLSTDAVSMRVSMRMSSNATLCHGLTATVCTEPPPPPSTSTVSSPLCIESAVTRSSFPDEVRMRHVACVMNVPWISCLRPVTASNQKSTS